MKNLLTLIFTALFSAAFPCVAAPPNPEEQSPLTIERLVGFVPADARLKNGAKWHAVGTTVATQAMRAKAMGKRAEFTIKVAVLVPHPHDGHAMCMHSKPASVTINGTSVPWMAYIYFDADSLDGLGTVQIGDTVTISGVINKADIEIRGGSAKLACELLRAKIKPKAKPKSTSSG